MWSVSSVDSIPHLSRSNVCGSAAEKQIRFYFKYLGRLGKIVVILLLEISWPFLSFHFYQTRNIHHLVDSVLGQREMLTIRIV